MKKLEEEYEQDYEQQEQENIGEVLAVKEGISPQEAIEKLFSLEINEQPKVEKMKKVWSKLDWDPNLFLTLMPTREFVSGYHDEFDEYIIQGDFEDSLLLSKLHPSLVGYGLMLYQFAIAHSALTRSRGGFQQMNMRSYYGHSTSENMSQQNKSKGFNINPMGKR